MAVLELRKIRRNGICHHNMMLVKFKVKKSSPTLNFVISDENIWVTSILK